MGICSSNTDTNDDIKEKTIKTCGDINTTNTQPRLQTNLNSKPFSIKADRFTERNSEAISATTMANTLPNLKNSIKGLVSKQRNRYKQDGYNLDLTYITPNIIAMGFPAANVEGFYRNHIDDVSRMLEDKHKNHYKIYNLCSERSYDTSKFQNRVQVYPFDDHNPPKLDLIAPFCKDVDTWLSEHSDNVAVVHCKAGKGRTGTMICCYLLHSQKYSSADEALNHYSQTRTNDRKGVTIPSQVRYVKYYGRIIKEKLQYKPTSLYISKIILDPVPMFTVAQGGLCFTISKQSKGGTTEGEKCKKLHKSGVYEIKKNAPTMEIKLNMCLPLEGDIKVEFYSKNKLPPKVKQLQFWFNTFFVEEAGPSDNGFANDNVVSCADPSDKSFELSLNRQEIDIVNKKDKQNKTFSSQFKVNLVLKKTPTPCGNRNWPTEQQDTPSESSSESSEDDTNDDEWDSVVEHMDPRGVGYRLLSDCELATKIHSTSHDHLLTA